MDVWAAIGGGKPSPRTSMVYDVEPFRAAVRAGDWKLVWQATLPSQLELFDLAKDPGETTNLAASHPKEVAALQAQVEREARGGVAPLIFSEAMGVVKPALFGAVAFPDETPAPEYAP